eukprot:g4049.t1
MASQVLSDIFEKLHSEDKDFRFMATSDLLTELQKEQIRFDWETEKRLCNVILQKMKDTAGEISEIAVKCLSVLLPKIQDTNLSEILQQLIDCFLTESPESDGREMGNVGLKTVISSVMANSSGARTIVRILTPKLIQGIHSRNDDVVLTSLDITKDFIVKFGVLLEESDSETLLQGLLDQLNKNRAVVRKKTILCIGALSVFSTTDQLDQLCKYLMQNLDDSSMSSPMVTSAVQTTGVICSAVSGRMGVHIDTAIAKIMSLATASTDDDIELVESCIRALESFISKCPLKTKTYLESIISLCLNFLRFDPNFSDDFDEMSEQDEMQIEEDDEDMYSDEEAYSDDEDDSWKVRKASASCLGAIFLTNAEQIFHIYTTVSSVLISRFGEREENVRTDVLDAYIILLRLIKTASAKLSGPTQVQDLLEPDLAMLMKMINRQLKEKSMKTRLKIFQLLKEVALVLPDQITHHTPDLVIPITKALNDHSTSSSDLKIEVLSFLQVSMKNSRTTDFLEILPIISKTVFDSVEERYYKVVSAALQVCIEMVHIIRPSPTAVIIDSSLPIIPALFTSVMKRLSTQDVDQEVKEYSIKCAAHAVAVLGDIGYESVHQVLQILLERLKSETTRLTTVKALTVITGSSLELPLTSFLGPAVEEFTLFLKKANMSLRQASLRALEVSCGRPGVSLEQGVLAKIIQEAVGLISDTDLHMASSSLDLMTTLAMNSPSCRPQLKTEVLPGALDLVQSPLLQGAALESLKKFFVSMLPEHFDFLFKSLVVEVPGKVQQLSTARCVAALCCHKSAEIDTVQLQSSIQSLLNLNESTRSEALKRIAILCLGEIGRHTDLQIQPKVEKMLLEALQDSSEDVSMAASYSYGALTLGNLSAFLPELIRKIQDSESKPRFLYLLLQSLNEALSSLKRLDEINSPLEERLVLNVATILLSEIEFEEDSKNVAAECLGQLLLLHSSLVSPLLIQEISKPVENCRYIIITAIRHAVVDHAHPVDKELEKNLPMYLDCLSDGSRHIRKASVQLLSSVLSYKYPLVKEHLPSVLPTLYMQTRKNQELIRVIDFGPFKHKIDDGIELRKASFECMNLLIDVGFSILDITEVLKFLEAGLADEDDIKTLCYPMVIKLSKSAQAEVVAELQKIIEPMQKTLSKTIPKDAVKHEHERHQDLVLSCLKVVDALSLIPGLTSQQHFKRLMDQCVCKGEMNNLFQKVQKERASLDE